MKRMICLLLAFALIIGGCSSPVKEPDTPEPPAQPTQTPEPEPDETPARTPPADDGERMLFTDSLGRELELPVELKRLIPATAQAQLALYALSPELLAQWGGAARGLSIGRGELELPEGDLSDYKWGVDTLALYKESGAQAMLIMGTGMDTAAVDSIQEAVGMSVVYLDAGYEALAMSYLSLGGLFGLEQEAQDIYLYIDTSLMELSDGTREIPEDKRQRIYFGKGSDGLTAASSNALMLAGCINAGEPGKKYAINELEAIKANQYIFSKEGAFSTIIQSEEWAALDAISMGLYYEIPDREFAWIGGGMQTEHIIGAKWLAGLVYPERFAYDMVEEARMFYDLFYHVQLTTQEAEAILENSSLKPIG